MSFITSAYVTAQQVYTVMCAIVMAGQTLVHIYAILPVVRHQNVASRALAVITTLGVYADVRAAGIYVVLEFLALVDVLAGPKIASQTEAKRAGTTSTRNSIGTVHLVTMMGTIPVVALAAIH